MFEMRFENQYGKLRLSGGENSFFQVTKVEGLGLVKRDYHVASLTGQAGQVLLSCKDLPRTVTISGDVCASDGLKQRVSEMMKILYYPGKLTIFADVHKRVISCRCTTVSEPKYRGKQVASVVLQFVCDNPYFTDDQEQESGLLHRKHLVQSNFTLPCIFTERIHRMQVINAGDVETEPVLTVFHDTQGLGVVGADDAFGLEIINHTTGQNIVLVYETVPGETVTIDIPKRRVTSDVGGDMTSVISQNSFLNNFVLLPGVNDIEVVNYSVGQKIGVTIAYNNRYIEAVM